MKYSMHSKLDSPCLVQLTDIKMTPHIRNYLGKISIRILLGNQIEYDLLEVM